MRLFIITGDPSGDVHAAAVVKALRQLQPDIEIAAVGGLQLKALGVELIADQSKMARVGFGSFLGAPYHFMLGQKIMAFVEQYQPDAVLHIDYGVFNLYMAAQLKARGFKTFYFIPPQVWASRPGRIQKIKKTIDHVFCIFPFEAPLYEQHGIPVTYVGHPLVGQLPPPADKKEFCQRYGLSPEHPIIGLFPGSRSMEINYLLNPMLATIPLLEQAYPQVQFVLAKASHLPGDFFKTVPDRVKIIEGENHAILSLSDALIVASGTVTLEAALYGTPMVIVYRGHRVIYEVAKRVCRLPYIGLPNILCSIPDINQPMANRQPPVVPELWQFDVNPTTIADHLLPLLNVNSESYLRARQALSTIQHKLVGPANGAAQGVAESLLKLTN